MPAKERSRQPELQSGPDPLAEIARTAKTVDELLRQKIRKPENFRFRKQISAGFFGQHQAEFQLVESLDAGVCAEAVHAADLAADPAAGPLSLLPTLDWLAQDTVSQYNQFVRKSANPDRTDHTFPDWYVWKILLPVVENHPVSQEYYEKLHWFFLRFDYRYDCVHPRIANRLTRDIESSLFDPDDARIWARQRRKYQDIAGLFGIIRNDRLKETILTRFLESDHPACRVAAFTLEDQYRHAILSERYFTFGNILLFLHFNQHGAAMSEIQSRQVSDITASIEEQLKDTCGHNPETDRLTMQILYYFAKNRPADAETLAGIERLLTPDSDWRTDLDTLTIPARTRKFDIDYFPYLRHAEDARIAPDFLAFLLKLRDTDVRFKPENSSANKPVALLTDSYIKARTILDHPDSASEYNLNWAGDVVAMTDLIQTFYNDSRQFISAEVRQLLYDPAGPDWVERLVTYLEYYCTKDENDPAEVERRKIPFRMDRNKLENTVIRVFLGPYAIIVSDPEDTDGDEFSIML